MRRTPTLLTAAACLSVAALAGCSSSTTSTPDSAAATPVTADDAMRTDAVTSFATLTGMMAARTAGEPGTSPSPSPSPYPSDTASASSMFLLVDSNDKLSDFSLGPLHANGTETDPEKSQMCIAIGRADDAMQGTQKAWVIWLDAKGSRSTLVPGITTCEQGKAHALTGVLPSPSPSATASATAAPSTPATASPSPSTSPTPGWDGDKDQFVKWTTTIPASELTDFGRAVVKAPVQAVDALASGTAPSVIAAPGWSAPSQEPAPTDAPTTSQEPAPEPTK